MKEQNFIMQVKQAPLSAAGIVKILTFFIVFYLIGLIFASCLNPIGFTPDLGGLSDNGGKSVGGTDKPGDTSAADNPSKHPDPDKGIIIFKNLTGGQKAMPAVFGVTGQEHAAVNINIALSAGQERSITLLPGHYDITITFEGTGSPITGTKALLAERVEYVYFYAAKDGSYKGGINVDSSIVYGDIDLNFYQDNENAGDNNDSDSVVRPEEGDVSRDDYPRHKLPSYMRENYGIVWVHNMSKTKDLTKALFDHFTDSKADDPAAVDAHWEMNPGPVTGGIKSIILRPGEWKAKGLWLLSPGDAPDPDLAGGLISPFTVAKAGAANYINHLYFYKGNDGKWYLTGGEDSSLWVPPYDTADMNPAGAAEGGGQGEDLKGEGQYTNEGGLVDTGNVWWDSNRNNYGILQVKNLSSRAAVDKVSFEYETVPSRKYELERISPRGDRSIVLGTGTWNPVTIYYTVSPSPQAAIKKSITINPVGLTGRINNLYFYYTGTGYDVSIGDTPPDYQNDSGGGGGTAAGQNEGDSPGALNDTNRDKLGLLVLRNLSPDVAVDRAEFTGTNLQNQAAVFAMIPGPAVKDQKSILLGSGQWTALAGYTITASAVTPSKTVIITAGQVTYLYFYKTRTGSYAISPSWPPLPDDSAPDNADPSTVIGSDEGWLNVINSSASGAIIDRVQYNNGGTWIDIGIPTATGTIAPGNESDPDLVVLKGSWSFRFKTLLKQTYSRSVSRTIRAGQIVNITYTDALDSDEPPDGYGTLRIVNDSPYSVYRVKYTNLTLGSAESGVDINISQNQNQVLVLSAPTGKSPPYYAYTVKCYISSGGSTRYVQEQVNIENQKIATITITNDAAAVTESGNDGKGHVRIYNNYDNYETRRALGTLRPTLPLKFFKVGLKGIDANTTGFNVVDGGLVPDDAGATGQLNLRAGTFTQLDTLREGQYELWILWGNTISGDSGSLTLTKYGIYDISKNTYRDIYIDFYSLNTAESSAVNMRITHVGYPAAAGITQLQIWYGGDDPAYDDPGEGRIPARSNGPTNDTYIVYKNNDILYAGEYREWKLVPGKKYWARAHWPLWNNWVGTGGFNQDFTLVQLANTASTGHLQFVLDDTNNQLKFFSDQAAGIKLNTLEAARVLMYRPGFTEPSTESVPHNFFGLRSVVKNEHNNYIEGIDITPYAGTYPVVFAENKYFNAAIHWFKRIGVISNNSVGWGPPVELAHTGTWENSNTAYTEQFAASDSGTLSPGGWYYAEVILSPKQGYDVSDIPANTNSSHFFQYDDYSIASPAADPIVLAPAADSNSNIGGSRAAGRIHHGSAGAQSGMTGVLVSGNQIKVRLWFRETQPYPNPAGGTPILPGYPPHQ
jgi:hypothetical protein